MTNFSTFLQSGASSAWLFLPSAVLLGLAVTISHTAIVWLIALGEMYFGQQWIMHGTELYLELASAAMILFVGLYVGLQGVHGPRHAI